MNISTSNSSYFRCDKTNSDKTVSLLLVLDLTIIIEILKNKSFVSWSTWPYHKNCNKIQKPQQQMLSTLRREFNIPKHFSVSQRRYSAAQLKFDSFLSQEMPPPKPKEEKRSVLSRLLTDPFKILPPYFLFDFVGSTYVSEYSLAQNHRPNRSDKWPINTETCLSYCSLNN